ncbi:MAG: hypothetical protein JXB32_11775 [Deltaproteobacteria bacterium]|nr:hypothetical protein [Deltaproteobacteria bacterium]
MVKHQLVLGAALAVLLAAAPAQAQKVYVNGVDCTGLISARFEGATVSFDEQGNIRIDAPGYRVQVIEPGGSGGTASTPGTTTTTTTTSAGGTSRTTSGGQTVVYSDSGRAMTSGTASYNAPIVEQTTTTVVTTTGGGTGTTTARTTGTTGTTATGSTATTTGTGGGASATSAAATPPTRAAGSPAPTKKYFLVTQGTGGAAVGETVQVNINGQAVRTLDSAGAQIIMNVTDWLNVGGNAVTMLSTKKQNYVAGSSNSTFQVIIGEGHVEPGGQVVIDNPLVTYTRTAADATANSRTFNLTAR